ncbi:isocitrate lyase/phosphoenolpyruvate mutase family protein [Streptomyces sp. NPDC048248]|uniref:isocitrate lyase/PEP mutase family protein n=1 Tax=Streptomyces sp. NPDC048248 TaxID=3365523 RepID=UPI00372404E2
MIPSEPAAFPGPGTDDAGPGTGTGSCTAAASHVPAFHALHHADEPLLLPNAWDVASAAVLADAGYAAVGTTSLGIASSHGYLDGQGLAEVRAATLSLARRLGRLLPCPYTVDIEGGFVGEALRGTPAGGPDPSEQVASLAEELANAGASGVNLEDGLPGGAGLQDTFLQAGLIEAVKERAPRLFLNARIDTHWLTDDPPPLSVTLARAERYLAAGADGVFVPGVVADEGVSALVAEIPVPVNILFAPGRHTIRRLADLGVRRVSTGSLLFRTALRATLAAADSVRASGTPYGGARGAAEARTADGRADAEWPGEGEGRGVPGYEEVQRLAEERHCGRTRQGGVGPGRASIEGRPQAR